MNKVLEFEMSKIYIKFIHTNYKIKHMGTTSIIGIVALVCAIWVIYQVWAVNKGMSTLGKVVWTICALLFSIVTAIVYLLIGRK